jgi:mono/diheme cytochrome c family protein
VSVAVLYANPASSADPVRGQKLFQNWCATCHSPDRR